VLIPDRRSEDAPGFQAGEAVLDEGAGRGDRHVGGFLAVVNAAKGLSRAAKRVISYDTKEVSPYPAFSVRQTPPV